MTGVTLLSNTTVNVLGIPKSSKTSRLVWGLGGGSFAPFSDFSPIFTILFWYCEACGLVDRSRHDIISVLRGVWAGRSQQDIILVLRGVWAGRSFTTRDRWHRATRVVNDGRGEHVIIPVEESEIDRISPVETEMSDGVAVRGWGYREDRMKRLYMIPGYVLGFLGCVF